MASRSASASQAVGRNQQLTAARAAKKDEFYTQIVDIERELHHYRNHFKDKVVYCNCDDPYVSAFFEYFAKNFEFLGLNPDIPDAFANPVLSSSDFAIIDK